MWNPKKLFYILLTLFTFVFSLSAHLSLASDPCSLFPEYCRELESRGGRYVGELISLAEVSGDLPPIYAAPQLAALAAASGNSGIAARDFQTLSSLLNYPSHPVSQSLFRDLAIAVCLKYQSQSNGCSSFLGALGNIGNIDGRASQFLELLNRLPSALQGDLGSFVANLPYNASSFEANLSAMALSLFPYLSGNASGAFSQILGGLTGLPLVDPLNLFDKTLLLPMNVDFISSFFQGTNINQINNMVNQAISNLISGSNAASGLLSQSIPWLGRALVDIPLGATEQRIAYTSISGGTLNDGFQPEPCENRTCRQIELLPQDGLRPNERFLAWVLGEDQKVDGGKIIRGKERTGQKPYSPRIPFKIVLKEIREQQGEVEFALYMQIRFSVFGKEFATPHFIGPFPVFPPFSLIVPPVAREGRDTILIQRSSAPSSSSL